MSNKMNYNEAQLRQALTSLAFRGNQNEINTSNFHLKETCHHIYGFNPNTNISSIDAPDSRSSTTNNSFFVNDHQLSMLQIITATRILDYDAIESNITSPSENELLQTAKEFHESHGPIINLRSQIQTQSPSMALAAEFKRASPSKGDIAPNLHAGEQALLYTQAGACIISVLTEGHWFKGSLDDLTEARVQTSKYCSSSLSSSSSLTIATSRPAILRKDFCISRYMIAEAAASGADTILLIVAITPLLLLKDLITYARDIHNMEPLVEVHAMEELDVAIRAGAKVIGVNNRNLHTFQLDLATTDRVADELQKRNCTFDHRIVGNTNHDNEPDYVLCSLSGMSSANDVDRYRQKGVGMCLIGESLMRAADPKAAIKSLCLDPKDYQSYSNQAIGTLSAYTGGTKIIKVCGMTNVQDALAACKNGCNLIGVIFAPKSKRCVTTDQARDIVQAVQKFGERTSPVLFPKDVIMTPSGDSKYDGISPLQSFVVKSRLLEELGRRPLVVGVFQNQSHEFIQEMVNTCGLDLVQLHGQEGMEAANVLKCGVPAIRVVDIETNADGSGSASVDAVQKILDSLTKDPIAILLDTSIKGSKDGGGTGVTFDWSIAEKIQNSGLPVIIAGGLNPSNIKDAVSSTRPWGVDVSSGVELTPGKKDLEAVETFIKGSREAAAEALKGF